MGGAVFLTSVIIDACGSMNRGRLLAWHARFGWWSLLFFTTLGLALELLHGFKAPVYLDASNETRRLMWTLAHAHGTLLSIIHILLGWSSTHLENMGDKELRIASRFLTGATILLPGGFFLGGIVVYGGDPGLSILFVPAGAIALISALFLIARRSKLN